MTSKKKTQKTKDGDKVHLELETVKSMLARALADYDNLNKRVERERENLGKFASLGILTKLFTVMDNLESAQMHLQDAGLAIAIEEFKKVFTEEGLTEIKPKIRDEFDEKEMEAIEVVEKGGNNNTVAELVLPGWKYTDGTVIRYAKVKVINK